MGVWVTLCDKSNKNMFSEALVEGVVEAFAHIQRTPEYKVCFDIDASGAIRNCISFDDGPDSHGRPRS